MAKEIKRKWGDIDEDYYHSVLDVTNFFFVYGSLQQGQWNSDILKDAAFITVDVTVPKFLLGDVGYPYAFPETTVPTKHSELLQPVRGEVWCVEDIQTAYCLDLLEGFPHHYNRVQIKTAKGYTCWMYVQESWSELSLCKPCKYKEGAWEW